MKAGLQHFNLLGVLALAVLCVVQWQHDRRLNLELNRSEKLRGEALAKAGAWEKAHTGVNEDLAQIKAALAAQQTTETRLERELALSVRTNQWLLAERDKWKSAASNSAQTVALQNERIREANRRIGQLASNLNLSILKFNELVTNYNQVVGELNGLRATNRGSAF